MNCEIIYWFDAGFDDEQNSEESVSRTPPEVMTIGWILKETERFLIVAQHLNSDESRRTMLKTDKGEHVWWIPKGWIAKRIQLKEVDNAVH